MISGFSRYFPFLMFFFLLFGCKSELRNTKKEELISSVDQFQFPVFNPVPKSFVPHYYDSISLFYRNRIAPDFNGMFLVAKNGEIIYERYKGMANHRFKQRVDKHTPLHVASISKVVTAISYCYL
jgi:hypothetical protein